MSQIDVTQGTTARATFETLDRANGTRTAADSAPTVESVHVNGAINSTLTGSAAVAQLQDATPANITGYYEVSFATSSLTIGDDVDVTIQATIGGFTAKTVKRFLVSGSDTAIPVIR